MSPSEFKSAREDAMTSSPSPPPSYIANGRPYFPTVEAKPSCQKSILTAASVIVYHPLTPPSTGIETLRIEPVSGGITNALFKISNFPSPHPASVLVRIFGAVGMIDRDDETSSYASLCDAGIAYQYLGRFENGRIEGWLEGYRPVETLELSDEGLSVQIAERAADLHGNREMVENDEKEAGMWDQISSWLKQAMESVETDGFKGGMEDRDRARKLLEGVGEELEWMKDGAVPEGTRVCFCHNDLLAANVMVKEETGHIQLIDFEYGGINYAAFDIANHFNEFAGGTVDGTPDYSLFPTEEHQSVFITAYLTRLYGQQPTQQDMDDFHCQVKAFVQVNHFYWALWGINQAAAEGCEDFDYLMYAGNRLARYFQVKES